VLVGLYRQRWRIEDAFLTVKSLLGLSYFFCAADNAVNLQVWATWILYAVLVDLTESGPAPRTGRTALRGHAVAEA